MVARPLAFCLAAAFATAAPLAAQGLQVGPPAFPPFSSTVNGVPVSQVFFVTNPSTATTVEAPAGFEVSSNNTTFAGSLSLPASVSGYTNHVRIALTNTNPGSLGGLLQFTSGSSSTNLSMTGTVWSPVYLRLINDSDQPDSNVFVKLVSKLWSAGDTNTALPSSVYCTLSETNPQAAATVALTSLPTAGVSTSSITGLSRTNYLVQVYDVDSAQLYFLYGTNGQAFSFTNGQTPSANPTAVPNGFRYDYVEFSFQTGFAGTNVNAVGNDLNNAIDITYVDKFGLPLQLEWFAGTNTGTAPLTGSYTYASTRTIVSNFQQIGFSNAVFGTSGTSVTNGWTYAGTNSWANFARVVAPSVIGSSETSPVTPYVDASLLLSNVVSNNFILNGNALHDNVWYAGYTVTVSNVTAGATNTNPWLLTTNGTYTNGWVVTLAYSSSLVPSNNFAGTQYTNTITIPITNNYQNAYVYGVPVGTPGFYYVGTNPSSTNNAFFPVESWMIGDVFSAMNFGFVGGRYGTNSGAWFSVLDWNQFPFGNARSNNDGSYNTYAALLYNAADGYGYVFSERITPNVLLTPLSGDTITVAILPDEMLDAPVPTVTGVSSNSVSLAWNPVAGVGGYLVTQVRPETTNAPTVTSGTNLTISNLQPGLPFSFRVQGQQASLTTPGRIVQAVTEGTPPNFTNPATPNSIPLSLTFNGGDPFGTVNFVSVGGATNGSLNSGTYQLYLTNGTNWVPVKVMGKGSTNDPQVFYYDYLKLVLSTNLAPVVFTNTGNWFNAAWTNGAGTFKGWSSGTSLSNVTHTNTAPSNSVAPPGQVFTNTYTNTNTVPLIGIGGSIFYGQQGQAPSIPGVALPNNGTNLIVTFTSSPPATNIFSSSTGPTSTTVITTNAATQSMTNFSTTGASISLTFSPTSGHRNAAVVNATGGPAPPSVLTYSNWLTNYPSLSNTNQSADPDGDSFNNGVEYAFDGNPTVGSPAMLTAAGAGTNSVFRFTGLQGASTNYTVQSTTNLAAGPWTNAGVTVTNASDQSGLLIPASYERREFTVPAVGTNSIYRIIFNNP